MEAGSLRSESWHAWVLLRALFQIGAFLLYPHVEDRQGREMDRGKTEKEREKKMCGKNSGQKYAKMTTVAASGWSDNEQLSFLHLCYFSYCLSFLLRAPIIWTISKTQKNNSLEAEEIGMLSSCFVGSQRGLVLGMYPEQISHGAGEPRASPPGQTETRLIPPLPLGLDGSLCCVAAHKHRLLPIGNNGGLY